MQNPYHVAILVPKPMADTLFTEQSLHFLHTFATANEVASLPQKIDADFMAVQLNDADACITGWGTPPITDEMLSALPRLKLVSHAAGSIKRIIPPSFWGTGRRVASGAPIIAEDVAQTTLALMLAGLKQIFSFNALTANGGWTGGESGAFRTRRLNGLRVGIVGASMVGRGVIRLIQPFGCETVVYDPLLSSNEAQVLGVTQTSLEELLKTSDVVSLHAPALPETRHMIGPATAPLLKDGCLFINTARGALVDEAALVKELQTGRISACIDVTDPEPPAADHPFRTLPNVVLMPHVAGGHTQNGRQMLGANAIQEIYTYFRRGQLLGEVRQEMLPTMA